ncbi:hypothetical protein ACOMHN_023949 [Nucella lapillus]
MLSTDSISLIQTLIRQDSTMKTLSPWTLPPDLIPQQIISPGHHMAHNPGMDQQHMVDFAHPLDVVLVALEFPPSPP